VPSGKWLELAAAREFEEKGCPKIGGNLRRNEQLQYDRKAAIGEQRKVSCSDYNKI
jgi:hypothetical protein